MRVAMAKPEMAAIFLVVNGFILLGAERLRRRAEVRELARREGMKDDGGRILDTLEYREAAVVGVSQSTALIAGISRDGVVMATGLARGLDNSDAAQFAFLLATPIILAAGLFKVGDLTGPHGARDPRRRRDRGGLSRRHSGRHRALPDALLPPRQPDPVRHLLRRVRAGDGHL